MVKRPDIVERAIRCLPSHMKLAVCQYIDQLESQSIAAHQRNGELTRAKERAERDLRDQQALHHNYRQGMRKRLGA